MSAEDVSKGQVRREDVEVVVGVLAVLDSQVIGGAVHGDVEAELARQFVRSGRLETAADGALPSAGRVARALSDLIDRLRFVLGEYETEPGPLPETTTHVLDFQSEGAALACRDDLRDGALGTLVERAGDQGGWRVCVVYAELSPDAGFRRREQILTSLAAGRGGMYRGSQGALPDR